MFYETHFDYANAHVPRADYTSHNKGRHRMTKQVTTKETRGEEVAAVSAGRVRYLSELVTGYNKRPKNLL